MSSLEARGLTEEWPDVSDVASYTQRWLAEAERLGAAREATRSEPDSPADREYNVADHEALRDGLEHDYPSAASLAWERDLQAQSLREIASKQRDDEERERG